jgi:hypothetical protein
VISLLDDTRPAKPRLMYRHPTWVCRTFVAISVWPHVLFRLGYGRTPEEAYRDWEAQ